jgi:type II secretory pathway pseudopilin PulG
MIRTSPIRRSRKPSEEGYVLLAVICMLALMTIALSVAMPRIASDIQRDREVETMRRGQQYIRAIQLYYRKFHAYPPSVDALVKTNNIRFLRKKYVDPTTRKEEWHPIMFGQNKTPMAMGFFGQPLGLGGSPVAGTGPGGGNGIGGAAGGGSSLFPTSSTDPTSPTAPAAPTDPGAAGGATGGSGNTAFGGQTFGGGGIIGVSPMSPKPSILVYKKKSHYNEWEFLYSPLSERGMVGIQNPGIVTLPLQGGSPGAPPSPSPTPTPQ